MLKSPGCCVYCGRRDEARLTPQEMQELFDQTPIEVWREYSANGYSWPQMIKQEFSYA